MDISGVDVDFLNDEEILELCSDIVDTKSEEISVLKGIDVNNLSDDKSLELYDEILYGDNNNSSMIPRELTDKEVMDLNYNVIDMQDEEIYLLNGKDVNFENLSDDEMVSLYDDMIETNDSTLLAGSTYTLYYIYKCAANVGITKGGYKKVAFTYDVFYFDCGLYSYLGSSRDGTKEYNIRIDCSATYYDGSVTKTAYFVEYNTGYSRKSYIKICPNSGSCYYAGSYNFTTIGNCVVK